MPRPVTPTQSCPQGTSPTGGQGKARGGSPPAQHPAGTHPRSLCHPPLARCPPPGLSHTPSCPTRWNAAPPACSHPSLSTQGPAHPLKCCRQPAALNRPPRTARCCATPTLPEVRAPPPGDRSSGVLHRADTDPGGLKRNTSYPSPPAVHPAQLQAPTEVRADRRELRVYCVSRGT